MTHQIITDFSNLTISAEIKLVLLDLDNTLYKYDTCHSAGMKVVGEKLVEDSILCDDSFLSRYADAQQTVKTRISGHGASHSRLLYFYELLQKMNLPGASDTALILEDIYWKSFFLKMILTSGAQTFLELCQNNKIPVVILTDLTTRIQFEKLSTLGITTYITYVLTSEAIGVEKPDTRIFSAALKKYNTTAMNTVMIGDDPDKDIAGASALGINTIQISHEKLPKNSPSR